MSEMCGEYRIRCHPGRAERCDRLLYVDDGIYGRWRPDDPRDSSSSEDRVISLGPIQSDDVLRMWSVSKRVNSLRTLLTGLGQNAKNSH
jgi:hypothetical protein